jgi:hypothetical protein
MPGTKFCVAVVGDTKNILDNAAIGQADLDRSCHAVGDVPGGRAGLCHQRGVLAAPRLRRPPTAENLDRQDARRLGQCSVVGARHRLPDRDDLLDGRADGIFARPVRGKDRRRRGDLDAVQQPTEGH